MFIQTHNYSDKVEKQKGSTPCTHKICKNENTIEITAWTKA